jgi:EpsI family protein
MKVNPRDRRWLPVLPLLAGVLLVSGTVKPQRAMELRQPLPEAVPLVLAGWEAREMEISEAEQQIAGMSSFVNRLYLQPAAGDAPVGRFTVYVGYYERQAQGSTIHSPRNCLPGGGWEPLTSSRPLIPTPLGEVPVNRYLIGNGPAKAVVLYWYQGRGRVAANEYLVKWDLLRDQATLGRSDEALVRVIVPVTTTDEAAFQQAAEVAGELMVYVDRALPARDTRS